MSAPVACLTLQLLAEAPPHPPLPLLWPRPPGTPLQERDPYDLPSAAFSAHFALRWGTPSPLAGGDVARLLDALEDAWALFVEDWQFAPPDGTDTHTLNVYIGDTGGPASHGAYGYYSRDPEGWPMLVLSPEMVAAADTSLTTIPHELLHALQDKTGHFADTLEYGWFWESTASWVEGVLYPEDPLAYVFLFGYALQPQRPLDLYVPFSSGNIAEYRAYGAGIVHRYLDEHRGERDRLLDAWRDPTDPLDPLANLSIEAALADFGAHNAVWDYAQPEILTAYLDLYAEDPRFSSLDARIVAEHDAAGTGPDTGWAYPPAATLPEPLGHNVLRWGAPPPGTVTAEAEVPPGWQVQIALVSDASGERTVRYLPPGTLQVAPGESLYLVVAAPRGDPGEEGDGYRYRFLPAPDGPHPQDSGEAGAEVRACACHSLSVSSGRRSLSALALALFLLAAVRRRG